MRIRGGRAGGASSIGTAFFFQFPLDVGSIPILITNFHVVKISTDLGFRIRSRNADGSPNHQDQIHFNLPYGEANWVRHPYPAIDLAALPVGGLLEEATRKGKPPFFSSLMETELPSAAQLLELSAVETILMVGYPNGLWDEFNNLPITRAGITAAHPAINYGGRTEYVIDAACFAGSSGSPVFLHNTGSCLPRAGSTVMGGFRMQFLGVLYAGPVFSANGEIRVVDVPTQLKPIPISQIPMNLGFVIKAARILEFGPLLYRLSGLTRPLNTSAPLLP